MGVSVEPAWCAEQPQARRGQAHEGARGGDNDRHARPRQRQPPATQRRHNADASVHGDADCGAQQPGGPDGPVGVLQHANWVLQLQANAELHAGQSATLNMSCL